MIHRLETFNLKEQKFGKSFFEWFEPTVRQYTLPYPQITGAVGGPGAQFPGNQYARLLFHNSAFLKYIPLWNLTLPHFIPQINDKLPT
jgi:hypothetical protein